MTEEKRIQARERARKWYAKNKIRWRAHVKEYQATRRDKCNEWARTHYHRYRTQKIAHYYSVPEAEMQQWLDISICEICGSTDRKLVIDHKHGTTGIVRGRLCHNCNSGLGQFKDNPDTLELAAKYLRDREEKTA